jgi:DNA-binding XRE family transcriptional regulator
MPRRKKSNETLDNARTIDGTQLAEWRVYTMRLTQQQLCDAIGITRRTLTTYEDPVNLIPRWLYLACRGYQQEVFDFEHGR